MRANRNLNECMRTVLSFLRNSCRKAAYSFRRDRPCRGRGFKSGRMRATAGAAPRLSEFKRIFPVLHLWRGQPAGGRRWRAGAAWRWHVPGGEALFGCRAYLLSERKTLRCDRPCLLVWRCLPWPPDRQWRGLRPGFYFRRASDDALAKLRTGHQSEQSPFADCPRQRSRAVCCQPDHGCFAENRRGARFPPKVARRGSRSNISPPRALPGLMTTNCSRPCGLTDRPRSPGSRAAVARFSPKTRRTRLPPPTRDLQLRLPGKREASPSPPLRAMLEDGKFRFRQPGPPSHRAEPNWRPQFLF